MKSIFSFLLLLWTCVTWAVGGVAGPYRVDLRTDPAVVPVGKANLVIAVKDTKGVPVSGLTIRTLTKMPGMNMGEREQVARPTATPGEYTAPAVFAMAGGYTSQLQIEGSAGRGTLELSLQTGQASGAEASSSPVVPVLLGLVGVVAIVVAIRTRRRWASRGVLGALALLGASVGVAVWAVHNLRRPGAMTPIEAQAMEMNTPAPEGTLPVRLAPVEMRTVADTVRVTGQVVPYLQQSVSPRVGGVLVWMPLYVGDRVRKGQVVARLDTRRLDPSVDEKRAGVSTRRDAVEVAQSELQQAKEEVSQAHAEAAIRMGSVQEAEAGVAAAQEELTSARAERQAVGAQVADADAQVTAAQTEADYRRQERDRMAGLLAQKAVSKSEAQAANSEYEAARARVTATQVTLTAARSRVAAADAGVRRAEAMVRGAQGRVAQAKAELHSHHAHVRSSEAASEAARRRVREAGSAVQEAEAGLRGAQTERDFAEVRAEIDGVVSARPVSPGQLVDANQTVLEVVQDRPVRLQANLPERDLARIRVGAPVVASLRDGGGSVDARVTVVAPSVDPMSRTGLVEAVVNNADGRLRPGQYLTLEITAGEGTHGPAIPASALAASFGEEAAFVWVAKDGQVERREVQLGPRSKDIALVTDGVKVGEQVVLDPPDDLRSGMSITSIKDEVVSTTSDLTVTLTKDGYQPASVDIPANTPTKVTFIRKVDPSCGDTLAFPDLGIKKDLPFGKPVTVAIPARPAGTLKFACGMGMYEGMVVVK